MIRLSIEQPSTSVLTVMPTEAVNMSADEAIMVSVNDYDELQNKPSIEGVELIGDKSFEELNLQRLTNTELENMLTL